MLVAFFVATLLLQFVALKLNSNFLLIMYRKCWFFEVWMFQIYWGSHRESHNMSVDIEKWMHYTVLLLLSTDVEFVYISWTWISEKVNILLKVYLRLRRLGPSPPLEGRRRPPEPKRTSWLMTDADESSLGLSSRRVNDIFLPWPDTFYTKSFILLLCVNTTSFRLFSFQACFTIKFCK